MALIYLVNKPQVLGIIVWWLLLFLEYDFIVVYKLGETHIIIDSLWRLPNIIKPTSDALPSSLMDSNVSLNWKQQKSKELGHVPWFVALWG
jgi:hypothetical protein